MKICRTLRAAFIGLWLSGCSVVVFEDGPACPADRACPVVDMPPAAPADVAPAKAENVAPAKTPDQALGKAPTEAATKQAKIDIKIDGYLSYFDYDSAVLSQQTLSGLLLVADYLKSNPAVQILVEGHCDEPEHAIIISRLGTNALKRFANSLPIWVLTSKGSPPNHLAKNGQPCVVHHPKHGLKTGEQLSGFAANRQ